MKLLIIYTVVTLLAVCDVVRSAGPAPNLTLYSEVNQGGISYTITEPHYDLSVVGFDNEARSVCGIGLWFLYEAPDYGQVSSFVYVFANHYYTCQNLGISNYDQISSVRYAGTDDIDYDSLTLYQYTSLEGTEYLVLRDISDLNFFDNRASSVAVTGNSSWTLYRDKGYSGGSVCVVPVPDDDGWFYGLFEIEDLEMEDNQVSSVKKGCFSSTVVEYDLS